MARHHLQLLSPLAISAIITSQMALASADCLPFRSSLNNSNCAANMTRERSAESSVAACREWCCNATEPPCNSYEYHNGAGQCWVSQASVDPEGCRHINGKLQWIGESRMKPAPPTPPAPKVARKRGYSGYLGNDFTCNDAAALNLKDSWWYNWIVHPSQYSKCKAPYSELGAEYVPMINGIKALPPAGPWLKEWKASNVHFLLGYNEPDYGNGHNHPHMCSPADAAKAWPQLQDIAAQFDPPLELVSPSVSTDGWNADGESKWLDEFLGNCTHVVSGCNVSQIKYLGFHDYQGNVSLTMRRINGAYARYGMKVWITEFAILGCPWCKPPWTATREQQDAFMREILPVLDSSDAVFRYAWFTGRNAPNTMNGGSNLLPYNSSDTTPTSTGAIYAAA